MPPPQAPQLAPRAARGGRPRRRCEKRTLMNRGSPGRFEVRSAPEVRHPSLSTANTRGAVGRGDAERAGGKITWAPTWSAPVGGSAQAVTQPDPALAGDRVQQRVLVARSRQVEAARALAAGRSRRAVRNAPRAKRPPSCGRAAGGAPPRGALTR